MAWLPTIVSLTAIALVLFQGLWFFMGSRNRSYRVLGGTLNLFMAAGGVIAFLLFKAGALIASPEYGILLMQGTRAWIWACILLVGISLSLGLIWQTARRAKGLPGHLIRFCFCGIAMGLLAASRVHQVNPTEPGEFCIRFYDMWWPPFLTWAAICLSQWITTTIRIESRLQHILWAAFFVAGISFVPLDRVGQGLGYADLTSLVLWKVTLWVSVPLFMALSPLVLINSFKMPSDFTRFRRFGVPGVSGVLGLTSAILWTNPSGKLLWIVQPRALWIAWILMFGALTAIKYRRGAWQIPSLSGRGPLADSLAVVAILLILASVTDMSHFIWLDPAWDLAALIFGWTFLLEVIAGLSLPELLNLTKEKAVAAKSLFTKLVSRGRKLTSKCVPPVKALLKVGLIWKIAVVWILVVALAEIPNTGKTIVHPFSTVGTEEKDKDFGTVVSDRIANTLSLVGQEIRPDLLVAAPGGRGTWMMAASDEADALQVAAKSSNIEIPGTKLTIPLEILTTPIQNPVRKLLGVRTIHGSIQKDGDTLALLASSSSGETWRILSEQKAASTQNRSVPQDPPVTSNPEQAFPSKGAAKSTPPATELPLQKAAGNLSKPVLSTSEGTESSEPASNPEPGWIDKMAYQIISSDTNLHNLGMTSSWKAVQPFRNGLADWKEFERTDDYDILTKSIESFRHAIEEDPGFALAYYRLGRALTRDGQPGAAVDAFRHSLDANPSFVAGHIALADALYNFDDYRYTQSAGITTQKSLPPNTREKYRKDATNLWRRVIRDLGAEASAADQAVAYAGLCHSVMKEPGESNEAFADNGQDPSTRLARIRDSHYAAFFYCRRAEYLYSQLPPKLRAESEVRIARASALIYIGQILDSGTGAEDLESKTDDTAQTNTKWSCALDDKSPGKKLRWLVRQRGPYLEYAMAYYRQAIAVRPEDWQARCYLAIDALATANNDSEREVADHKMNGMRQDDRIHIDLGNKLSDFVNTTELSDAEAADYYRSALKEYDSARELVPTNIYVLNNYADTVWQWRLRLPAGPPLGPDAGAVKQGEEFIYRAASLVQTSNSRDLKATVQSTLGEVLLAMGRPLDAIEVLENPLPPAHAFFDDVRWGLAQAYLCSAASSKDPKANQESSDLIGKAAVLLNQIREHELNREDQPYTNEEGALDVNRPPLACQWKTDPKSLYYKLQETTYSQNQPCEWLALKVDILEHAALASRHSEDEKDLYLHFWGGGLHPIDAYLPANKSQRSLVLLSLLQSKGHTYYVQLVKRVVVNGVETEQIVSGPYGVSTEIRHAASHCSGSLITLKWVQIVRPLDNHPVRARSSARKTESASGG